MSWWSPSNWVFDHELLCKGMKRGASGQAGRGLHGEPAFMILRPQLDGFAVRAGAAIEPEWVKVKKLGALP
jgi:hypothetical protein